MHVPSWRFDIAIEADLLEELARVYGYNRLAGTHISADLVMPASPKPPSASSAAPPQCARLSRGNHLQFVDPKLQQLFDPRSDACGTG